MKREVFVVIVFSLLSAIVIAQDVDKIYILNLDYDRGNLNLVSVVVQHGYAPDRRIQPEVGYNCSVASFSGETLYSFKFEVPNVIYAPPPIGGEAESGIYLEQVNFSLTIPYFRDGKTIYIYDSNDTNVLSVDVSQFADFCGDGVCSDEEDYQSCSQDCTRESEPETSNFLYIIIILISVGMLLIYKSIKRSPRI